MLMLSARFWHDDKMIYPQIFSVMTIYEEKRSTFRIFINKKKIELTECMLATSGVAINGDIYEKDIICDLDNPKQYGIVEYSHSKGSFVARINNKDVVVGGDMFNYEIIGNAYETPDLLMPKSTEKNSSETSDKKANLKNDKVNENKNVEPTKQSQETKTTEQDTPSDKANVTKQNKKEQNKDKVVDVVQKPQKADIKEKDTSKITKTEKQENETASKKKDQNKQNNSETSGSDSVNSKKDIKTVNNIPNKNKSDSNKSENTSIPSVSEPNNIEKQEAKKKEQKSPQKNSENNYNQSNENVSEKTFDFVRSVFANKNNDSNTQNNDNEKEAAASPKPSEIKRTEKKPSVKPLEQGKNIDNEIKQTKTLKDAIESSSLKQVKVFLKAEYKEEEKTGRLGYYIDCDGFVVEKMHVINETTARRTVLMTLIAALKEIPVYCNITIYCNIHFIISPIIEGWLDNWAENDWKHENGRIKDSDLWGEIYKQCKSYNIKWNYEKAMDKYQEFRSLSELFKK